MAELRELRRRQRWWRRGRRCSNGNRRRKLFGVSIDGDATNGRQASSGCRQRRIAPGEKEFAGALCYNEVARGLRDYRNRWPRIAAFTTGDRKRQRDQE